MKTQREKSVRRAQRNRTRLRKFANGRPRLSVHRSAKNIYAQIIDDVAGKTLVSASSLEEVALKEHSKGWDTKAAEEYSPKLCHALAKYIAVTQPVVAAEEPKRRMLLTKTLELASPDW